MLATTLHNHSRTRSLLVVSSIALAGVAGTSIASAQPLSEEARSAVSDSCSFARFGRTLFLRNDCTTDATLTIPDGFTFDGRDHTVTVVDPEGGSFSGPVITNAGSVAHVRNVKIRSEGLVPACHALQPIDQRFSGILLRNASGSIVDVEVDSLTQESGCQEGGAIEVRSATEETQHVLITANRVRNYQKTGILVLGNVDGHVTLNRVEGSGPIDYIAQNGIQISDGANATVRWNSVSGNVYTGTGWSSGGIITVAAGPDVVIELNRVSDNDVGVWLNDTSSGTVRFNNVSDSTYVPIYVSGTGAENRVVANHCSSDDVDHACTLE